MVTSPLLQGWHVVRKLLRILAWTTVSFACLAALACFVVYRAWRHEPDFYVEALQAAPEQQAIAGDAMVKNVLDLHNALQHEGSWDATFTAEQINGWLAIDLPTKFADTMPESIKDPRVVIAPDEIRLAFRYVDKKLKAVLSLTVNVQLTDDPNVIAIRVRKARAGRIPIPLNRFIDQLKLAAQHSDVELRWVQEEGDPVALVQIPIEHPSYETQELRIEAIELSQGELHIVGRSGQELANGFIAGTSLSNQEPDPSSESGNSDRAELAAGDSDIGDSDIGDSGGGDSDGGDSGGGDSGGGDSDEGKREPTKRIAQERSGARDKVKLP